MSEPETPPTTAACRNCGSAVIGRFCHACGQDEGRGRVTVRALLAQVTDSVVDVDSTLWTTVRGLTRSPGRFAREWVDGRRAGRFTPFRYVFWMAAFAVVVSVTFFPAAIPNSGAATGEAMTALDRLQAEAGAQLTNYLALISVMGVPFAAVVLWLAYRKTERNLAEACVLVAYVTGQTSLLGTSLLPLTLWQPEAYWVVAFLLQYGFTAWGARDFYQGSWHGALLKSLAAMAAYYVVMTVISALFVVAYVIMKQT